MDQYANGVISWALMLDALAKIRAIYARRQGAERRAKGGR